MSIFKSLFKSKAVLLLVIAVVSISFMPHLAHAADASAADTGEKVAQSIAKLLSIAMQFLNALLWPLLIIIGDLMKTDLILGPGMESTLKAIWVPVRDLVNIGFVVVLLVVAFYNVLGIGGGEGDLALKTALPKIILGLVIVNFTFVAGKVVIDLTNVATTAVFALPELAAGDATPYDFSAVTTKFKIDVCYKSYDQTTGSHTSWGPADETAKKIPIYTQLFCAKSTKDGTYDELDGVLAAKYFTDLNANNIGLVMAVNMGGLSNLSILKSEGINNFTDLTVSFVFSVVMYMVFAISYLVLAIVLITRLIVLWMALALSPLAVLTYVVPQIKEWTGGGGDFAQKVTKHLVAPIIIGATMSLGYILISAWDGLAGNSSLSGGGFQADQVISTEFLINGIKDLPHFIIAIASIVIVWTGVFAAASDTYASFATDAIKGFGTTVRDFAFKLPMSIPTVPLSIKGEPNEPRISPMALKMWGENAMANVSNGTWASSQLQQLPKGSTFFGIPINTDHLENRNPAASQSEIRALIAGTNPDVDYTKATDIARNLINLVRNGKGLSSNDQGALIQKIETLREKYAGGEGDLTELRKIVDDPKYNYENLGFSDDAELDDLKRGLRDAHWSAKNAPNAPATPTVTPAQAAAIKVAVDLSLPSTQLGAQLAPLSASGIPATAAKAGTDLKAAQDALTALSTTPSKASSDAAKKAVQDALASAAAAQADTTVTGALKTSVDTTHAELIKIQDELKKVTL